MTNVGERTEKKPGSGVMSLGLSLAGLGTLFAVAILSGGGMPTMVVWAVPIIGVVLAIIGFARRLLAAVESR